ncbi:type IV secretion system DNA-binding domain-containing protein, partial [Francisella philomiragia]
VLSLFCIPLLVFLFGPVPFVVGLGFAVFLWAAKLESRKIYNSSVMIVGLVWLCLSPYSFWNSWQGMAYYYYHYGSMNGFLGTVILYFRTQSILMSALGIYGGAGMTVLVFNAIYDLCYTKSAELGQVARYSTNKTTPKAKKIASVNLEKDEIGVDTKKQKIKLDNKQINQMLLGLGTTGVGKTVFFRNLYARHIMKNEPCIVIDGKPDDENINYLKKLAQEKGVPFYGFNCANNLAYDFLNNGTPTEIKDKIIGLKNEQDWDSDYYKTQAETYLQTAIEVLKSAKEKITLDDVIDSMEYDHLVEQLGEDASLRLIKRIERLKNIENKDLKGIQNQLTLLANSDFGDWLSAGNDNEFTLLEVIEKNGFVYFALPALKYPNFANVMGKLVVNDIKTAISDKPKKQNVFCYFDEFSVFAGEQVMNLVNQGRGLGLHCGFGTQTLADLEKGAGNWFVDALMGNINTVNIMRVNDNKTVNYLADWIGTHEVKDYKINIDYKLLQRGSVSIKDQHIIRKSEIQQLANGQAYLISKVYGFTIDQYQVNYIEV